VSGSIDSFVLPGPGNVAMEPVNLFTITSFFHDEPNVVKKGLNSYESGRICYVCVGDNGVIVGKVGASMKKKVYDVKVGVWPHLC